MKADARELTDSMPPANIEAERALLGSVLMLPSVLDDVSLIASRADFYDPAHQVLFGLLLDLHNSNKPIDAVKIAAAAKKVGHYETIGGAAYLAELINNVATPAHAVHYAELVAHEAIKREVMHAGTEILRDSYNSTTEARDVLNRAEESILGIRDRRTVCGSHAADAKDVMMAAMAQIDARIKSGKPAGLSSGFPDLDPFTGFRQSELLILAARPSMGKTALAINIALNVSEQRHPVLFFSFEMSAVQLADRMLSSWAQVRGEKMGSGSLDSEERSRIIKAAAAIGNLPLVIDDAANQKMQEIAAVARRTKRRKGLELIVIDYLQLIEPDNAREPREQQVSRIARRLKGLARELNVPVLCLAQLNRQTETAKENRPRLSHLRESGAIEQDADVVMFVHRPEYFHPPADVPAALRGKAEVLVEKNRNGPKGDVNLVWLESTTTFKSAAMF